MKRALTMGICGLTCETTDPMKRLIKFECLAFKLPAAFWQVRHMRTHKINIYLLAYIFHEFFNGNPEVEPPLYSEPIFG